MKALVIPAKAGIYLDRFRIKSGMTMVFLAVLSLSFFWPVWLQGKLPIPADALVGLYHPFRDYFSDKFPQGVPYKNFILTDPVLQQYPWKWLAIRTLFGGESLGENPYSFGGWGASSIENIQAGTFYPSNILFFLINNFPAAWTVFIIIQPILGSLFMFWWLKNNGIKQPAAIFGGLVWAFSSFSLVWMEWGNIGHAGLWLPLALLAVDKIAKRKKDTVIPCLTRNLSRIKSGTSYRFPLKAGMTVLFWHVLLQFSLVASLLAGHWQITLYLLLSVFVYVLFFKRFNLAAARPAWQARLNLNKMSLFFAHCSLLIVLTVPQWLPAWRFMSVSNRAVEQENVLSREGFFIGPKHLIQLAVPDFFGNPATGNYRGEWNYSEQVIYVGIIPLILAVLALLNIFTKQTRKDVVNSTSYSIRSLQRFGLILIVVGLIFAVKNPIAEIPYRLNIPIWSDLQPTRLGYLVTFGLSILAAVGLENLIVSFRLSSRASREIQRSDIKRRSVPGFLDFVRNDRNVAAIIGGLGVVFLILLIYSSKFDLVERTVSQRNLIWPVLIWGLFGMFYTLLLFIKRFNLAVARLNLTNLIVCLLLLVVVFDLFRFGWKFTPFSPAEYLYPVTPAIKFLQENMGSGDKYMTLDRRILPPNANIMYKLESIEGYDPIYSRDWALLITRMETGELQDVPANFGRIVRPGNFGSPLAGELGVKYVLALGDIKDDKLTKVFQEGETRIYELVKGE